MITSVQLRMARAALQWGVRELAEKAELNPNTVTRIENGRAALSETLMILRRVLEDEGVEFIGTDGVRFRHSTDTTTT
ncbi:MAG: helix-turn-helix domain-containing protein [Proteobacteria bacterium]|nr:helix-turn-helix domain-containing protein [Pseudomonadota bacterium]